mmetsp:Transcript_8424/g.20969  ORF Transcript_8424/g.20969 Transcript_8424/m.20969 type:complete len:317 (+) Transcript_8424:894-1844(+)
MVSVSEVKVHSKPWEYMTTMNRPRHMVLFMVTAPYTWLYVSEMFFLRFLEAKYSELTSSEALEAKGVRTKDAKNGDGSPRDLLREVTAPTMGSANSAMSAMPPLRSTADLRMICALVGDLPSSASSASSSSSSSSSAAASSARRNTSESVVVAPSSGSSPLMLWRRSERVDTRPVTGSTCVDVRRPSGGVRAPNPGARVSSSTQCAIPAQNSGREMSPSPSLSNSRIHTLTSASVTTRSRRVSDMAVSEPLSSWVSTCPLPSASNWSNKVLSAATLISPSTKMPPTEAPNDSASSAPYFRAWRARAALIFRRCSSG